METSTKERLKTRRVLEKVQNELLAALRDVPKDYRGLHFSRVLTPFASDPLSQQLERAFAVAWARLNDETRRSSVLENLLIPIDNTDDFDAYQDESAPESLREWEIAYLVASTMAQYLGTKSGRQFIQTAFQIAGGEVHFRLPSPKLPVSE